MKPITSLITAALVAAFLMAGTALAQHDEALFCMKPPGCDIRELMLQERAGTHGEIPRDGGVTEDGFLIDFLFSTSGSWSVYSTDALGLACPIDSGAVIRPPGGH